MSEGEGAGLREKRVERRGVGVETGACGVRKVGAASNGDSIREPNGGPMLPEELRPAPGECVYSRLIIPKAGEALRGATVGEDIEDAQELPVDPARGGHGTWEEGVGSNQCHSCWRTRPCSALPFCVPRSPGAFG